MTKTNMVVANIIVSMILVTKVMIMSGYRYGVVDGLSMQYYWMTCPFAEQIVKNAVNKALQDDPTLAAGLVRMHFHDCFIEVILSSSLVLY